jgi:hypothetical protein
MSRELRNGDSPLPLKITTWNVEHSSRLLSTNPSSAVLERRQRIKDTIESIDPDIFCLEEGPEGEQAVDDFCTQVLDKRWVPVLFKKETEALGLRDKEYKIRGTQWIWFLVKPELLHNCRIQPPSVWKAFTGKDKWIVHFWGKEKAAEHFHWRHPQVLIYRLANDQEIEIIGVHLKSKINMEPITRNEDGDLTGEFLNEALKARVKLATEAYDIRQYIATKFEQTPTPGIVVVGDCNDGPGKDFFEDQYLFFDLISNLQGDVMISERFFNHALFDFAGQLRWTAKYEDKILELTASQNPLLLDHILISQPLCRKQLALVANENAGKVEHEAYERCNAGAKSNTKTRDHRPVSCKLDDSN